MIITRYYLDIPVKLAVLGDFHNGRPEPIIKSLQKEKPSLICIPGDLVYGTQPLDDRSPLRTQKNILPFLTACVDIAPTFLSLGNHEWLLDEKDLAELRRTGAVVLDNSYVRKDGVVIGGLTSAYVTEYRKYKAVLGETGFRYPRKESKDEAGGLATDAGRMPETDWLKDFLSESGCHILLNHHPEYFDLLPGGIDLMLCGHCHGGQIRYWSPKKRRWCGLFAPGQGWFPKYTSGVYRRTVNRKTGRGRAATMIVTRGLTNTAAVPRLFNPTEIVYVVPASSHPSGNT